MAERLVDVEKVAGSSPAPPNCYYFISFSPGGGIGRRARLRTLWAFALEGSNPSPGILKMKKRPPIVAIFGHIDHGKTTLLDTIQKTKITETEAGGITQKVSAYEIEYKNERITFIDTPGHEAFEKLREKGAKVADIGILVVAADEGVKQQTIESIELIKHNNLPFIVAINKIDKPNANPEKIKKDLSELGVIVEDWGGDVPCVNISALKGINIDELLDLILILAGLLDLKYEENKNGEGYILEATKDPKRGILAGCIVLNGAVKVGDYIVTSSAYGKIRFMEDSFGRPITKALPSTPVLIGGFESLPFAGEIFKIGTKNEIEKIKSELEDYELSFKKPIIVGKEEAELEIFLIIKADLIGSIEGIIKFLEKIASEKNLKFKIIKKDIGLVTIDDLKLAKEAGAFIISFNLKNPKSIHEEVKNLNLNLIEINVIYELEEIIEELIEIQKQQSKEKGRLEVLATFSKTASKKTIGGKVISGKISLNDKVLILKDEAIIGRGKIISLESNKIPVSEVTEGNLCGLIVNTKTDINVGDVLVVI